MLVVDTKQKQEKTNMHFTDTKFYIYLLYCVFIAIVWFSREINKNVELIAS